jgi:hypothetical protein
MDPNNQGATQAQHKGGHTFIISVIASIVASLLVGVFFQPIINGISEVTTALISSVYKGYVDGSYRQAAAATTEVLAFMIFGLVVTFPIGMVTATTLLSYRRQTSIRRRLPERTYRHIGIIWLALSVPMSILVLNSFFVAMQEETTFKQQMMALEPFISETERKDLLRQWALLKTREDYVKVKDKMTEIAKKYSTTLPPPLI